MKFYYSVESTPLKFHKAFYKVLSPILMGVQTLVWLATIGYLSPFCNIGIILNFIISGFSIVVLGFITYGFAKKKQYAWYMVYTYLILNVSSNIISAILSANAAVAIGQIIGALIIPTLIGIYYYKRKPLFVSNNISISDVQNTTINYCRKCGNRVTKDSVFCNKCGAKIDWN